MAGVALGALAWLQMKTGLGLSTFNWGVARVARTRGGLWFVGVLGRWFGPFPLEFLAAAVHAAPLGRHLSGAWLVCSQVITKATPSISRVATPLT